MTPEPQDKCLCCGWPFDRHYPYSIDDEDDHDEFEGCMQFEPQQENQCL